MSTYVHNEVATGTYWGYVLPATTNGTNTATELVMNNTDGTFTHIFGAFNIFLGAVTGGTITGLERTTGSGTGAGKGAVFESITGIANVDVNAFLNLFITSAQRMTMVLAGDDTMTGYSGDELIFGFAGSDTIHGGGGSDTIFAVDGSLNDNADNTLFGDEGDDALFGGDGADVLNGGSGTDTMEGGIGDDIYVVDSLTDVVTELVGGDIDKIQTTLTNFTLTPGSNIENLQYIGPVFSTFQGTGDAGNNVISGSEGNDFLFGLAGVDTLEGNGGNDYLDGGVGADTMYGGQGDDTYEINDGGDTAVELAGQGSDWARTVFTVIDMRVGWVNMENLQYSGASSVDYHGNTDINHLIGGAADDFLDGDAGNDTLDGGDGNDDLTGGAGDDHLNGGAGNDTIHSGDGADVIDAGSGDDLVLIPSGFINADGGTGVDTLDFRDGFLTIGQEYSFNMTTGVIEGLGFIPDPVGTAINFENVYLDNFRWVVTGNAANNGITGGTLADTIDGGLGNDDIRSGAGNDNISGGDGDDYLQPGAGSNSIHGGNGFDMLSFYDQAAGVVFALGEGGAGVAVIATGTQTYDGIENIAGSDAGAFSVNQVIGADNITGNSSANLINGYWGNDTLDGLGGADFITGGFGNDTIFGGTGADHLDGEDGNDTLVGNAGGANIFAQDIDELIGGAGNDSIYGERTDVIDGGTGTDNLYVVNDFDWTDLNLTKMSIEWVTAGFGNDTITAVDQTASVIVYASGGDDNITGSGFSDEIWAGVGIDTLVGGSGDDLLVGDLGADSLSGGKGNDRLYVDTSDTLIDGGDDYDAVYISSGTGRAINMFNAHVEWVGDEAGGSDAIDASTTISGVTVHGGGGLDIITGGSGGDFLWGEAGNDGLNGGAGDDTLVGGLGTDLLTGGTGIDTIHAGENGVGDGALDTVFFNALGFGTDFVYEFEHGIDKLNVHGTGVASVTILNVNGNAEVHIGADLIVVAGAGATLTSGDFIF